MNNNHSQKTFKIRCPECDHLVKDVKLGVRSYGTFCCENCGNLFEAKTSDKGVKTNNLKSVTQSQSSLDERCV